MKDTKKTLIEIFGWYGSLAILTAFGLASFGVVPAEGLVFQLLNLTGAIGLMTVSYYKQVFSEVFLNVAWAVIAIVVLIQILL